MFNSYDDENGRIFFAPDEEIRKYGAIADHFLRHILELDPAWVFLSDKSTLRDFDIAPEILAREIFLLYGVDPAEVEDQNLVRIFKKIDEEGIFRSF